MSDTLLKGDIILPEEIEDIILEDEELAQLESQEAGSGLVEDVIIDEDGDIVADTLIDDSEPDGDLVRDAQDDPAADTSGDAKITDDGAAEVSYRGTEAEDPANAAVDTAGHRTSQDSDEPGAAGAESMREQYRRERRANGSGGASDSLPENPAAADAEGAGAAAAGSFVTGTASEAGKFAEEADTETGNSAAGTDTEANDFAAESDTEAGEERSDRDTAGEDAASPETGENDSPEAETPARGDARTARTKEVVGVRFRSAGKSYYFAIGDLPVRRGSHVIVETSRGLDYGTSICDPIELDQKQFRAPVKRIVRIATPADESRVRDMREKEQEAYRICYEKIRRRGLDMKLIEAEYAFDGSKLLFYFTADERVDFRDLVKDLAGVFHTRIELRQIGVRDETRILGGYGICGRPLCCHTYLSDFAPVSIKMAKEQNLSLNPTKISGSCGRLMCCLKNEEEVYEELNQNLPKPGDEVEGNDGLTGEVIGVDILRQLVRILVEVDDQKELHEYSADSITILRRRKRGQAKPKVNRNELRDPKGRRPSSPAGRGHADGPAGKDLQETDAGTAAAAAGRETIRSVEEPGEPVGATTGENVRNASQEAVSQRSDSRREKAASPASARRNRQDNRTQPEESKEERPENEGRGDPSASRRSTRRSRQGTGAGRQDRTGRSGETAQGGQRGDVRTRNGNKNTGKPAAGAQPAAAEAVVGADNGARQENPANRGRHRRNRHRSSDAAAVDHAGSAESHINAGSSGHE